MTPTTSSALDRELDHELVQVFRDARTGVTGVIAVHSTALGPAMGGLRLRRYATLDDALGDALRLARAMTLKNAAAGLDLGGGKAVLIDDGVWDAHRAERLAVVGRAIDDLRGRYVTAEDVGTSPADMDAIAAQTRWVAGRPLESGGHGDPSLSTARTVFGAIEAAATTQLSRGVGETHVGVLGVGHVGAHLVRLLREAGARVTLADVDGERARAAAAAHGATAVPVERFLTRAVDVLAPCAMGELIGPAEVPSLRCRVIAGAANNPLTSDSVVEELTDRGILYVPDFIANCGGIVHVAGDFAQLDPTEVDRRIAACAQRTHDLLTAARESGRTPLNLAHELAAARLASASPTPSPSPTPDTHPTGVLL